MPIAQRDAKPDTATGTGSCAIRRRTNHALHLVPPSSLYNLLRIQANQMAAVTTEMKTRIGSRAETQSFLHSSDLCARAKIMSEGSSKSSMNSLDLTSCQLECVL